MSMHIDFLNSGEHAEVIITITPIRIGVLATTLQVSLSQKNKVKVMAMIASVNFEPSLGSSAAADWLHPSLISIKFSPTNPTKIGFRLL